MKWIPTSRLSLKKSLSLVCTSSAPEPITSRAHIRRSWPDSSLGFQVIVLKTEEFSLAEGRGLGSWAESRSTKMIMMIRTGRLSIQKCLSLKGAALAAGTSKHTARAAATATQAETGAPSVQGCLAHEKHPPFLGAQ
jgi:hypothetical protein